ncbi:MAG: VOC family protein [Eubacteriaceae bacterium]|jgi:catechol 2,3-dioxygenase-like lactoylglutathione lyase family enzyme|nr:VOC family protein [Eubacteriaceae bacterium]
MKVLRVEHTGISVSSLEKTIEFYGNVLGCKVFDPPCELCTSEEDAEGMGVGKSVTYRICQMEVVPGQLLEFLEFHDPQDIPEQPLPLYTLGRHHVGYVVEDIHKCFEEAEKLGVEKTKIIGFDSPDGPGLWGYIKDPDGNSLELLQYMNS